MANLFDHLGNSWLGWLVATLLLVVITGKTLPFSWHIRVILGYVNYRYFEPRGSYAPERGDGSVSVFLPSVYTTSTSPGDLDYTLHKSNSTYLADLDLARGRHFYGLFRVGLEKYSKQGTSVFPALGAVSCTFKKEIRPFAKVRIWTRVLAWDDKWIYLISHFTKAHRIVDTVSNRPSYSAKPLTANAATPQSAVYATCISKQVVKQGRKTIQPVEFLAACGLLPHESTDDGTSALLDDARASPNRPASRNWTARRIEERRCRGLALAKHVAALDEGLAWFSETQDAPFAMY
ncbi:hypothetical protein K432DRAFT_407451 [Lepidopterella palustris CBS 459.81]|uniref:Thioesterase/thiol ester dehydrase-isomerase n=1 Tax=Lepidopterella palustris CBS 459.81 TaxID=1314670 RepID=A0A8E2E4J8_9PEZI|nr:hypothetical protein K432DRAFT_407451 [Lepidopterella palustris CBS 459.81]